MKNIGFIGLGLMGSRMAMRLQKKYGNLTVYNRSQGKAEELIAAGAKEVKSLAELAENCEVFITMLSEPKAVLEFALGDGGLIEHMQKGNLWIDCTTVDPDTSRLCAQVSAAVGVRFMDAPVAGSIVPAENGQLIIFAGGVEKDYDEAKEIFDELGKKSVFMGPHGTGSAMKLVNNHMLGSVMAAYSEAIVLAEAIGFSKEKMADALDGSPVLTPFLPIKHKRIENDDYSTEFPLKHMHKDLYLASTIAYDTEISTPVLNTVKEVFAQARKVGMGDEDFSAVYKVLKFDDE